MHTNLSYDDAPVKHAAQFVASAHHSFFIGSNVAGAVQTR